MIEILSAQHSCRHVQLVILTRFEPSRPSPVHGSELLLDHVTASRLGIRTNNRSGSLIDSTVDGMVASVAWLLFLLRQDSAQSPTSLRVYAFAIRFR